MRSQMMFFFIFFFGFCFLILKYPRLDGSRGQKREAVKRGYLVFFTDTQICQWGIFCYGGYGKGKGRYGDRR